MRKLDPDVKAMTLPQLRQEVMRLRTAFRKEASCTGNRRCWITLLQPLPEGSTIQPLTLPRETFLRNCAHYYDRNQ